MKHPHYFLLITMLLVMLVSSACQTAAAPTEETAPEAAVTEEGSVQEPTEAAAAQGSEPLPGFFVPADLPCNEIVVYSSFPDEEIAELAGPFQDMTGISISNVVVSSGEGLARIKAEAANPQADYWLSVRGSLLLDALNNDPPLIAEYKPKTLDQIAEVYQYPDSTVFTGIGMYPLVFHYNPAVAEELGLEPPRTYEDLIDPKYEGLLVMPHPGTSGTAYSAISLFLQMYGEEEGWDFIRKMAENMDQFTRSGRAPQNMVAQGEYPFGIGFFDAVWYLGRDGFPIEPIFPVPIFADPFSGAVVAGARNEACAELFYDYLLTVPAQEVFLNYGTYGVREDVAPPEGAPPLSELDVIDYDWQTWGERREEVLNRFVDETAISPPPEE
ncbi:MAG TPA: extracellular solute-binding protein [Anaerolineales bacterium]